MPSPSPAGFTAPRPRRQSRRLSRSSPRLVPPALPDGAGVGADPPVRQRRPAPVGPDGLLYAGFGDGGYFGRDPDPHGNSQNLDVLLGKIVRLDVGAQQPAPQLVAYGLRNPWRFSFDPAGDLVIADVGWFGFEEVNVRRGARLAGPYVSDGGARQLHRRRRLRVPGRRVARLRGRYVFGDFCSGRVWTARLADGRVSDVRGEPLRVPMLASFGLDAAGELYAVSLCKPRAGARGDAACPPRTGTVYRIAR